MPIPSVARHGRSASPCVRSVTAGSQSIFWTPRAIPTSWASCGRACGPPTPLCSSSARSTGWMARPAWCGRSAPGSACPARSCSPISTIPGPISRRPSRAANGPSGPACCRPTCPSGRPAPRCGWWICCPGECWSTRAAAARNSRPRPASPAGTPPPAPPWSRGSSLRVRTRPSSTGTCPVMNPTPSSCSAIWRPRSPAGRSSRCCRPVCFRVRPRARAPRQGAIGAAGGPAVSAPSSCWTCSCRGSLHRGSIPCRR